MVSVRSGSSCDQRLSILVFTDYFLPGYKGGGPIRTIAALVNHLRTEFRFCILTKDRDHREKRPYPNVPTGRWVRVQGVKCLYLLPRQRSFRALRKILRTTPHDVLYLNSIFSWDLGDQAARAPTAPPSASGGRSSCPSWSVRFARARLEAFSQEGVPSRSQGNSPLRGGPLAGRDRERASLHPCPDGISRNSLGGSQLGARCAATHDIDQIESRASSYRLPLASRL